MVSGNLAVSGTNGVAGVKYAMDKCGYFGDLPRLPLLPISAEGKAKIDECLKTFF
jgi:dihydrodipicolinate synthase/N-acetylneuraminate lyase